MELNNIHEKATEALENVARMTDEMEKEYEEKIEILKLQFEDACKQAEKYLVENQQLKKQLDEKKLDNALNNVKDAMSDLLDEENEELTSALKDAYEKMDFLELGLTQLREEANRARRDFTGLQLAVSVLIFVYGVIYGKYSCM